MTKVSISGTGAKNVWSGAPRSPGLRSLLVVAVAAIGLAGCSSAPSSPSAAASAVLSDPQRHGVGDSRARQSYLG
jgi:hypothetical protein